MDKTPDLGDKVRAFTIKSLIFSLLAILFVAGVSAYHDIVMKGPLMVGNHLSIAGFLFILLVGLVWNGVWASVGAIVRKCRKVIDPKDGFFSRNKLSLNRKELSVVFATAFVSSYPPTSGLFRYFHRMILIPWREFTSRTTWKNWDIFNQYVDPRLFPSPYPGADGAMETEAYQRVYANFFSGMSNGVNTVPLFELPLAEWAGPLCFWGPMIIAMALAIVAMQFVVHRQWAYNEQLSYPIAQVMDSFCAIDTKRPGIPLIFKNRLFWWGCIPLFLLLLLQYLSMWFPQSFPALNEVLPNFRSWSLPITREVPIFAKLGVYYLNWQTIYFSIVGVAYFVSSEVSLSLGFAPMILAIFTVGFFNATGLQLDGAWMNASRAGGYVGLSLILIYAGRFYYRAVFRRAFGFKKSSDAIQGIGTADDVSVAAARLLIIAFISFITMLCIVGVSFIMALFFGLLLMIVFLVSSRIVCETGIPFIQAGWEPASVFVKLFGPAAVGPKSMTFLLWAGNGILCQDTREALTPYVATGLKVADDAGVKVKKIFWFLVVVIVLALVVSFASAHFSLYNYSGMGDGWASKYPPVQYFDATVKHLTDMKAAGVLEASSSGSQWSRLGLIQPDAKSLEFFIFGIIAVVVIYCLRFRFTKFPIHPLMFVMWGTYPNNMTWCSFLIGWFIKMLVVRFGGGGVYQKFKPFFVGLIAAELLIVCLVILVDFFNYFILGVSSRVTFGVLPG